jgi:hypothetical protein
MEELFVLLVGAGVVALLPLVPALRPAVKTVVKGGLILAEATKATAAAASEQWRSVVTEAGDEISSETKALPAASAVEVAETAGEVVPALA